MGLMKIEQETVIIFNEGEATAEITTFNSPMTTKLDRLCAERNEAVFVGDRGEGERRYRVPKSWVKINAGPLMTDEQKERKREQLAQNMRPKEQAEASTMIGLLEQENDYA